MRSTVAHRGALRAPGVPGPLRQTSEQLAAAQGASEGIPYKVQKWWSGCRRGLGGGWPSQSLVVSDAVNSRQSSVVESTVPVNSQSQQSPV